MAAWRIEEYRQMLSRLGRPEDVRRISEEKGIEYEVLWSIFTQNMVRRAIYRHRDMLARSDELISMWKSGLSVCAIAEKEKYPPVLTARMILTAAGLSKKKISKAMKEPAILRDVRMEREIFEAMEKDYLYSWNAHEEQIRRGLDGEKRLFEWLDSKGWEYVRQDEMTSGEGVKTPDALLRRNVKIKGRSVRWLDSKALFGDPDEIKRSYRRQFLPYIERFGAGAAVYWYGYVEMKREPEGLLVIDDEIENL